MMKVFVLSLVLMCQVSFLCAKEIKPINIGKDKVQVRVNLADIVNVAKFNFSGVKRSSGSTPSGYKPIAQFLEEKLAIFFNCDSCDDEESPDFHLQINFSELVINYQSNYQPQYVYGLGLYRHGSKHCAYHSLDVSVLDASNKSTTQVKSAHPFDSIKSKYQHLQKCELAEVMKSNKIKWQKKFDNYKLEDQSVLYDLILDRIWDNFIETMLSQGLIEMNELVASRAVEAQSEDLLLIEKNTSGDYVVNNFIVKSENASDQIYNLAESEKKTKVLIGFKTKKLFTFKDLKIIKPKFKKRPIGLYRLGPNSRMIKVN